MGSSADQTQPTPAELAELSALADGTLEPARRAEVEARIAASPELSALYQRERRVLSALHEARATERAPAGLRARIEAARPTRRVAARRRIVYGGSLAGAIAVVALALVLLLPSGTPGAPSVSAAAALAARGPVRAAPVPDPSNPAARLDTSVDEVYFPNWVSRLGWRAVGERSDRLGGRRAVTVYYAWRGERIAYTIVGAPALAQPPAQETWRDGTELRTLTLNGRLVVTWRRAGDTCVLSGTDVTAAELQTLAAWKVPAESR
jgi:anti-sigma factor RsiW